MRSKYVGACLGLSHFARRRGEIPLKKTLDAVNYCVCMCVYLLQPWLKPGLSPLPELNSINCGILYFIFWGALRVKAEISCGASNNNNICKSCKLHNNNKTTTTSTAKLQDTIRIWLTTRPIDVASAAATAAWQLYEAGN